MNKYKKISFLLFFIFTPVFCINSFFTDVKVDKSPYYASIQYLTEVGVFDLKEKFNPESLIHKDAALKTILKASDKKIPEKATKKLNYTDVPQDSWVAPYVEVGLDSQMLTFNEKNPLFNPTQNVIMASFLKMLIVGFDIDISKYKLTDIKIADVPDDAWFSGYAKFAVKFDIIKKDKDNKIHPGKELTRGEVADLIFTILERGRGLVPQKLLTVSEKNMVSTIEALEKNEIIKAGFFISISENFINKIAKLLPDNKVIKSALKISNSLKSLVGAYAAGQNARPEDVVKASKNSWSLADEAAKLNPDAVDLNNLSVEIKNLASALASKARERLKELENNSTETTDPPK